MRANEFLIEEKTVTINIPISITIPSGNGDPEVKMKEEDAPASIADPVNVFPLQQELELLKHEHGKESHVIDQILSDSGAHSDLPDDPSWDLQENYNDLESKFNEIMDDMERSRPKRK